MIATASGAMLAGVAEAEPSRVWFGRGGCVEQHDDGTCAVFVRGELLGVYARDDIASRDVFIAVVMEQASREDVARAFRVSVATVGRVATRKKRGGARAVADYGRRGGWAVRTPKLLARLRELFEKGLGPRAAHGVVAKQASYGTVYKAYREWSAGCSMPATPIDVAAAAQPSLALVAPSDAADELNEGAPTTVPVAAPVEATPGEPTLEEVRLPPGAVVQHVGSWLLLGGLRELGFYDLDEEGCPLWRMSTTSHDSLCAWLMPVVEFANLSLGDEVTPVLVFDRGGAFPEAMAELRDAGAEFVTYERRPYPEVGATDFKESLTITLASEPHRPIRIAYTEARQKNLRAERGRVRRIALLMPDGVQVNLLAVSELPAEALVRAQLARWGLQENQLKHGVERWGINHLDGRRVEEYPPDALVPNPARRRLERVLKLSHTAEGEAWRKVARLDPSDPEREQAERDARAAMERQRELMALRASVPKVAPVSETPLAGKLRRHELGYKSVLDMLRITLANLESDFAVLLAKHMDRPREAKKLLATLVAAPGTVHLGSRVVTIRLMPAASEAERVALRAFLADIARRRLSLPGDPTHRRLAWALK